MYNYEDHATEFQLIENREERDKAIGSKYMQSKPGKIYKTAEDWLINHPEKRLLFVGMGCQADGFRKFAEIKGFCERVWIVDIICHGSPSPRLWKEYAESAEKKYGKITYLTFKDKRNGWKAPTAYVTAGGQEHLIKDYVKVFYNQCALRPSCYECPYATTERKTDMTIGDFWHIEETIPDFYDEKGNSIFLIHTDRGEQLFETVKPRHYRYPENNPKEPQKLHQMNCVTEKPYLSIFQHKLSFSLLLSNCHLLSAVYYCRHFYLVNYHQKNQCCNVNHNWHNELTAILVNAVKYSPITPGNGA